MNTFGYAGGNPVSAYDLLGLKYSRESCVLLADWISRQWKVFWILFTRSQTGIVTNDLKRAGYSAHDCLKFGRMDLGALHASLTKRRTAVGQKQQCYL